MNMHPCWLTHLCTHLNCCVYKPVHHRMAYSYAQHPHSRTQFMWHIINQSDDDDTLLHHTLSHARDLFHLTVCIFEWGYVLSFCTTLLVFPLHCCRSIPYNNSSLCRLGFPYKWFFVPDIELSHVHKYV